MHSLKVILLTAALLYGQLVGAASSEASASPDAAVKPPAAQVKAVTERLWGRKVTDNYRYMEALDPKTLEWMKAQGAYTRSLLDEIAPLAQLKTEVAKFSASFGLIQGYVFFGGRAFYQERSPGSDNFDLVVKDKAGRRNKYQIQVHLPLPEAAIRERTVGELLNLLVGTDAGLQETAQPPG